MEISGGGVSILRLLNIPIVFLLDNSNLTFVREMIKQLSANSFSGKIYVFSHYTNPNAKEDLYGEFPSLIWQEAGETMIYEELCANGKVSPTRVTFYLLPELLKESQAIVLWQPVDAPTLTKMLNQIRWWGKTRAPFVETKEYAYLDLDLLRQTGFMNQFTDGVKS